MTSRFDRQSASATIQQANEVIEKELSWINSQNFQYRGDDWDQLSEIDEILFGLTLNDMPKLVAVWSLYEDVHGLCDPPSYNDDLIEALRDECSWLTIRTVDLPEFQRFAGLFKLDANKAAGFYHKICAWQVRVGLVEDWP